MPEAKPVTVFGVCYPSVSKAVRILRPPANRSTIQQWLTEGVDPDEAFSRVPPGRPSPYALTVFGVAYGSLKAAVRALKPPTNRRTIKEWLVEGVTPDEAFTRVPSHGNSLTVFGITYPSIKEAIRSIQPPAYKGTIREWLKQGMAPDEAFSRIPTPSLKPSIPVAVSGITHPSLTEAVRILRPHTSVRPLTVFGMEYPSIRAAIRALQPSADEQAISKRLREGTCPDEAFLRATKPCKIPITVFGTEYQSIRAAIRALHPPATEERILVWLKDGMTPDDAFRRATKPRFPLTVFGREYPNIEQALHAIDPPASPLTVRTWLSKGMAPDEAFTRLPGPGYRKGIVYIITHHASGKLYVGLTITSLEERWQSHIERASQGRIKSPESLHHAIRLYGASAFHIAQVDEGTTKHDLEQKEREWIEGLGTLAPLGYNMIKGGSSGGGNPRKTIVDGIEFASVKEAEAYIAEKYGISLDAASKRLYAGRLDVKSPQQHKLSKTQTYRLWKKLVAGAKNPASRDYVPIHEPWRDFLCFLSEVGHPPKSGMVFVRREQSKGFIPGNCYWASNSQARSIISRYPRTHKTGRSRVAIGSSSQQLRLF